MRARLAALGAGGVRARTFHSAALAQLRHFAPGEVGRILVVEGAPAAADRERRCRAPTASVPRATSRPRSSGRRTAASRPAGYRGVARRPRAAAPARPDAARLPRLRGAQGRGGRYRLRGSARAHDAAVRDGRARGRRLPRPLPGVHRRRVPGRQPAPAVAARALARRPRRPLRRRRRLPVDLRLHGRLGRAPARAAGAVPARAGRPARGELPLDAAGARAREPARAEARRRREEAARDAGRTGPSRSCAGLAIPAEEGAFVVGRIRALHGEGLPLEEIAVLFRTNARSADYEEVLHEAGDPVPGRLAAGARRRARPAEAASRRGRPGGRDGRAGGARARLARGAAGRSRRARADPPERPRAPRRARARAR